MGKRIIYPSIEATTYSVAVTNNGKLAVDWTALAQAKNIEIKFLGNTRMQGSANGNLYQMDLQPGSNITSKPSSNTLLYAFGSTAKVTYEDGLS